MVTVLKQGDSGKLQGFPVRPQNLKADAKLQNVLQGRRPHHTANLGAGCKGTVLKT